MSAESATGRPHADETGVAAGEHTAYLLGLGDDALVYAQRLGEWLTRAPQIEEDLALGNVGLDLLGQARALLTHAGELEGTGRDEDALAFLRVEREYRNVHLVEQPRGDYAHEMVRLLWFSSYQHALYTELSASQDVVLAGVAQKALKEVTYHRDHAAQWVIRLGDGTAESTRRTQAALEWAQPYVPELTEDDEVSLVAARAGVGVPPSSLHDAVHGVVHAVVGQALLPAPAPPSWRARGGRAGLHSESLGYLLAEMQHLPRSMPGARW